MKHLLALDLSTKTGWCRWEPGAKDPTFGTVKFDATLIGVRNREARDWVRARILSNGVQVVVKEAAVPMSGDTNFDALVALYYLHGMVAEVCAELQVPLYDMPIQSWRKIFLGYSQAPKSIPKEKRSAFLKRSAVKRCWSLGWDVKTDDAADACGVAFAFRAKHDPAFAQKHTPLFAALEDT